MAERLRASTASQKRKGEDKWSKIITQWYPRDGKRKRGRPRKRWDDDIRQVAGKTWSRVARERLLIPQGMRMCGDVTADSRGRGRLRRPPPPRAHRHQSPATEIISHRSSEARVSAPAR
ncbi:hypothetical protein EVAR_24240_1 [Eumeta japonica]|uniref:Uncharacterized protein n=1 Tax=Eumeta variegata TaxID=151549 RepID=A0A4C1W3G4_EUMVA|nr:hypothetical protein EVAR_24240_1 [Eumeta japonica]